MRETLGSNADTSDLAFLNGDGEMARRVREFDWAATPLGPIACWQQSVKAAVSICLASRFPIILWLGPELRIVYNDAYIPFLGETKHPAMLGEPGRKVWGEIWDAIGPMHDVALGGGATFVDDFQTFFARRLPREEVYVSFSYSPIRGDDGRSIAGVFCACLETTEKIVGARRLSTLRELGAIGAEQHTPEAACRAAAEILATDPLDIPLAAVYLLDGSGESAHRVAAVPTPDDAAFPATHPVRPGSDGAIQRIVQRVVAAAATEDPAGAPWPLGDVATTLRTAQITNLPRAVDSFPANPWPEPVETALVIPLAAPGQRRPAGFLIAGLSPRRVVDADYRSFLEQVGGHIARSIAETRAFEAERRRAEALAELDRAKTAFFSNVSHEFRTPLTLMLGPLEEALASAEAPEQRARLETSYRNAERLLKLVNALLDFSRIEAGRARATFEPTDLATRTRELASVFRSAIERAGLRFAVHCPPLPEPVYVDPEMFEQIVLNLLSNALKFTFEGEIECALRAVGSRVELTVQDTGIGISSEELPHLFERFHRVEGARARTYEGSGIGLALVQDLVHLHGGDMRVESELDVGTTFIVSLPFGHAHLGSDQVGPSRPRSSDGKAVSAFVAEAMSWVRNVTGPVPGPIECPGDVAGQSHGDPEARLLIVDDNADMREYLTGLLAPRWSVEAVVDGEAALTALRRSRFDLVLTDVMMPRLDGFGLLQAMRADPDLSPISVVVLSARAGEESRIQGLERGADDYLIKPFSAKEVLTRVEVHLRRARAEKSLRDAVTEQRALLREVNHRVKNNLEVVNSLLDLQADYLDDPRARRALAETANRVRAIGEVHRLLVGAPSLAQVDLGRFARRLAEVLFGFYGVDEERVRFEVSGEGIGTDLERAVPLGLIINELLCNALKHAFPGGRAGCVSLTIDLTHGVLEFADDGIGLPPSLDLEHPPSLGLQLVQTLARQVEGTVELTSGPGTRCRLRIPPAQTGGDSLSRRSSAS